MGLEARRQRDGRRPNARVIPETRATIPCAVGRMRAVLFDAAGTLIRLREPVGDTYARFARQHGVRLPASHVGDAFRRVLPGMRPMAFPDAQLAERPALERVWWHEVVRRTFRAADGSAVFRDFDAMAEALFAHYAGDAAWCAIDGAADALAALRARTLRLAVVSNFDHRLPRLLVSLGLGAAVDHIVLPLDAGATKPDPAIFALALRRLDVTAQEALFVGDDLLEDVEGARAAGLRAIHFTPPATLAALAERIMRLRDEETPA